MGNDSDLDHGLWLRYEQGDKQVETEILIHYMHVVDRVALQLTRRFPRHIIRDDLKAAGMEGLWRAIRSYNREKMVPFEPYARRRIRGAILDELRKSDDLTRRQREQSKKARDAYGLQAQASARIALDDHERLEWIIDDSAESPEEAVVRSSEITMVNHALSKLTTQEQLVLSMVFVEGLNLTETAEVMSLSRSRIHTIYSGALKSLKGSLMRKGAGRAK